MADRNLFIIATSIVLAALILIAATKFSSKTQREITLPNLIKSGIEMRTPGAAKMGGESAKVSVRFISDFQDPFSGDFIRSTFTRIKQEFIDKGLVLWIFHDYPLENLHPEALEAAQAARCAGDQQKYWEYHDKLFEDQSELERKSLVERAKDLDLDEEQFVQCLEGKKHLPAVLADKKEAGRIEAGGVPGMVINGDLYQGMISFEAFKKLLQQRYLGGSQ